MKVHAPETPRHGLPARGRPDTGTGADFDGALQQAERPVVRAPAERRPQGREQDRPAQQVPGRPAEHASAAPRFAGEPHARVNAPASSDAPPAQREAAKPEREASSEEERTAQADAPTAPASLGMHGPAPQPPFGRTTHPSAPTQASLPTLPMGAAKAALEGQALPVDAQLVGREDVSIELLEVEESLHLADPALPPAEDARTEAEAATETDSGFGSPAAASGETGLEAQSDASGGEAGSGSGSNAPQESIASSEDASAADPATAPSSDRSSPPGLGVPADPARTTLSAQAMRDGAVSAAPSLDAMERAAMLEEASPALTLLPRKLVVGVTDRDGAWSMELRRHDAGLDVLLRGDSRFTASVRGVEQDVRQAIQSSGATAGSVQVETQAGGSGDGRGQQPAPEGGDPVPTRDAVSVDAPAESQAAPAQRGFRVSRMA